MQMGRYLRLAAKYTWTKTKMQITFRTSFWMNFLSQGLNYAVDFLLMYIMISAFDTINGWTAFEVMLLYAVSLLAYSFGGAFFYFVRRRVLEDIESGAFDDDLVKPVRTLPWLIVKNVQPAYITHLTLSIIMLTVCFIKLSVTVTVATILWLLVTLLSGVLIFGGMFLLITAPAFLITRVNSLGDLMWFLRDSAWYPVSIFPRFLQVIMTVVFPFAMINFYPVQPLIGKQDYLFFGEWIVYLVPLIAAAFFALSVFVFQVCMKRYKSTGS